MKPEEQFIKDLSHKLTERLDIQEEDMAKFEALLRSSLEEELIEMLEEYYNVRTNMQPMQKRDKG